MAVNYRAQAKASMPNSAILASPEAVEPVSTFRAVDKCSCHRVQLRHLSLMPSSLPLICPPLVKLARNPSGMQYQRNHPRPLSTHGRLGAPKIR